MEFSINFSNLFANRKMASFAYCFFFLLLWNRNKRLKFLNCLLNLKSSIVDNELLFFLAQIVIIYLNYNLLIDWISKKDRMLEIFVNSHAIAIFKTTAHCHECHLKKNTTWNLRENIPTWILHEIHMKRKKNMNFKILLQINKKIEFYIYVHSFIFTFILFIFTWN